MENATETTGSEPESQMVHTWLGTPIEDLSHDELLNAFRSLAGLYDMERSSNLMLSLDFARMAAPALGPLSPTPLDPSEFRGLADAFAAFPSIGKAGARTDPLIMEALRREALETHNPL